MYGLNTWLRQWLNIAILVIIGNLLPSKFSILSAITNQLNSLLTVLTAIVTSAEKCDRKLRRLCCCRSPRLKSGGKTNKYHQDCGWTAFGWPCCLSTGYSGGCCGWRWYIRNALADVTSASQFHIETFGEKVLEPDSTMPTNGTWIDWAAIAPLTQTSSRMLKINCG